MKTITIKSRRVNIMNVKEIVNNSVTKANTTRGNVYTIHRTQIHTNINRTCYKQTNNNVSMRKGDKIKGTHSKQY